MQTARFFSRRDFLIRTAVLGACATSPGFAFSKNEKTKSPTTVDVAAIDRPRILKAAQRYLHEAPITITGFTSPRNPGSKHDYFSEGDYWWPDPENPDGPYIRRDGMSNPNKVAGTMSSNSGIGRVGSIFRIQLRGLLRG
jgi:hypothetical protein